MKPTTILVADLFCGAGGSSTGARMALDQLGLSMKLTACNHWSRAMATHTRDHPNATHHLANLYKLEPRDAVPGGKLDLLMASPTCTFFSRARGGKPTSRAQRYGRMTPTQVVRWVTELDVKRLLVENVPEFQRWGPVHRETVPSSCADSGCTPLRACKRREGYYFRAWLRKLERAGFEVEYRVLNAADYGDATTRERLFLIGRSDGKPLTWPEPTHSKDGSTDLFGAGARPWRGAREIIDWSIKGSSIFTRKKPLSTKTLARIYAGAVKFGWPAPLCEKIRLHMEAGMRGRGTAQASATGENARLNGAVGEPFILSRHSGGSPRSLDDPTPTQVAKHSHVLIAPYYGQSGCQGVDEPLATVTTKDRFALVEPLAFIAAAFGERPGQTPRVHDIDKPAPTICATGRVNLVRAREWDVTFRMLQPHELAAAMGFEDYKFTGTKTEKVKQIGNAVPVNTSQALVGALMTPGQCARRVA